MSSNQPTKQTPRKRVVPPLSSNPNPKASSSNPNQANQTAAAAAPTLTSSNPNPKTSSSSTAAAASNPNPKTSSSNPNHNSSTAAAQTLSKTSSSSTAAAASNPNPKTSSSNPNHNSSTAAAASNPNPKTSSLSSKERQWAEWVEKAKKKKWDEWSFKPYPTGAIIPYSESLICKLHDDLAKVTPVDSVYAQTPCRLLQNRRFNMKLDRGYLVHSQRQLKANKDTVRMIANSTATWKNTDGWRVVAGENGEVVGMAFDLLYMYKQRKGQPKPPSAIWSAVEYISSNNVDGTSSLVVLTCKNEKWIELEQAVETAEHNLARSYQNLLNAQYDTRKSSDVPNLQVSVNDNLAILGSKIEELEVWRMQIKESEEMFSGVVNQGVQPQVGNVNIGSVTPGSEVVRNVEVPSSCRDVPVIERDQGAGGYFSVLSNKKDAKERRKSEKVLKEKAGAEKAGAEKALKEKAEKAGAEKALKEGKKN